MQKGKARKGMVSSIKNVRYAKAIARYSSFPSPPGGSDDAIAAHNQN